MYIKDLLKSTFLSRRYWRNRKIDWEQAYFNEHSHRDLLMKVLTKVKFGSIIEVGCASGKNLAMIRERFKVEVGGVDINEEAIETAKRLIPDAAVLEVSDATSLFLSNKSVDVVLTDMCLIYMDRFNINKAIKEIKRVARNKIVLCEFHHENFFKRLLYPKYNIYNYKKLLKKHGFWDIEIYKMTEQDWEGGEPQKSFGSIIIANI